MENTAQQHDLSLFTEQYIKNSFISIECFHSIEIFHESCFLLPFRFLFILLQDELDHPEGTFFIQNINTSYFL